MLRLTLRVVLAVGLTVDQSFAATAQSDSKPTAATAAAPTAGANRTALEALQRLKGIDLDANPALKGAVLRVLETTRGTPQFVELVRDFNLVGQDAGLLDVARALPGDPAGADAVRLLLQRGQGEVLRKALKDPAGTPAQRQALLQATAVGADPAAIPLLAEVLKDTAASPVERAVCVHGLARSETGAQALLALGRGAGLDDAVRTTASLSLAQCRWPAVRDEAAKVFPLPRAADGAELPSILELTRQRGDAVKGAAVFRSEQAACIKCHRVGAEGVDFGPALTEIGTKLARQALYEAILDPSAGISFGYEGWTVETRSGEELFGILASDTAEEVAVKLQTGVVVKVKKSDVTRRDQQKLSIMPAGLAQIVTRQQLVDVVEYLAGLKAK